MNNLLFGASMTSLRRMMLIAGMGVNETEYTVTGNPVSFRTNVAKPLGITVPFSPIQNLNGQSNPYPAGGGKNKFQTTATTTTDQGVTWTVNADGTITVSGTASDYTAIDAGVAKVSASMGNVVITGISGVTNIAWGNIVLRDSSNNTLATLYSGGPAGALSFDISSYADADNILIKLKRNSNAAVSGTVKIQVEVGSSATAWSPYSNICPISGYTQGHLYRTGVNVWDEEWKLGAFNTKGEYVTGYNFICPKNPVRVIPGATYYFSKSVLVWQYDAYMNHIVATTAVPETGLKTMQANTHYINFRTTEELTTYGNDISINYPSTDTEYHAYSGNTYLLFGKNLFDPSVFDGIYTWSESDGVYSGDASSLNGTDLLNNFFPYEGQMTISLDCKADTGRAGYFSTEYSDGTLSYLEITGTSWNHRSLTTTSGKTITRIYFSKSNNYMTYLKNIQFELGATETAYEPYLGTIYGGSLDVNTGVLTVEWYELAKTWGDFSNKTSLGNNTRGTLNISAYPSKQSSAATDAKCNIAPRNTGWSTDAVHFYTNEGSCIVFLPNDTDNSTEIQVVYPLATPLTYQLTPQEITALLGDNTIWTDTNGNNEIKYLKKG